jgi:hypothetical protein
LRSMPPPVPSGGSPDGTGGSPVLPMLESARSQWWPLPFFLPCLLSSSL